MSLEEKKQLINFLSKFIQPERLAKLRKNLSERTNFITVVLEDINQTHNISAAIRSCDCFAVQEVHIIENVHKFQVNENISRGANKWLDIFRYNKKDTNNTELCLKDLKDKGYKIVATTPQLNIPRPLALSEVEGLERHQNAKNFTIDSLPIDQKLALVFGTEEHGLSNTAFELCDDYVKIPMYGFTQSFNISVSVAICLYELTKRLRDSKYNWHLTDREKIDLEYKWLKTLSEK